MKFDSHIEVKSLSENVFDVWWNKGWDNWARVQIDFSAKQIQPMIGLSLPHYVRMSLSRYLKINNA